MVRVEIQSIAVRYGTFWAVKEVSLEIEPGEIFFLLGPSGCGKTTLLRAVAGLSRPAMGEVLFNGRPMNTVPVHEKNVGFVFQNYALWPHLTVAENVAYGLTTRGVDKESQKSRVATALSMLSLSGLEERYPGELSGGQQQRVAVARAVVVEPDVLLMDEPLSNLDARLRAEMRTELKALIRRLGVTTIYVTHDQREALSMADRVAVMRDGAIVQCASPRALYDEPANEFVASFVGETNVFEGEVKRVDDDIVEVKTPFEVLKATKGSLEVAKGDAVHVLVRPEDIAVGAALQGSNIVGGRVTDIAFAGGIEEVFVEVQGAVRVHVMRSLKDAETLELGETVEVAFDADRARLFKSPLR